MAHVVKILVVDDELPVAKSVASTLSEKNYSVEIALSGEEALKKQEDMRPDVIIADLMMPGISGMDLLKTVKKKNPHIMFIMITGYPSIQSAVQAIKLGAFDFIPKPFTPDELRSLVSRALERKMLDEKGTKEPTSVKGHQAPIVETPKDIYCIPENSWVKVEHDGNARIGVHHMLINTITNIDSLDLPTIDETRYQGEAFLWITDSTKRIHRIWTPITGKIIKLNEKIREDYSKLLKDPYGEGWLAIIAPFHLEDDLKNLVVQ
jgi:FixJ family two-component response regulator/glycine cleavage system H lipoate-binding protein